VIDPTVAVVLMLVVGAQLALQAPVNAGLARATGSLPAVLISFIGGTLLLFAVVAVGGQLGELGGVLDVHWYYLLGGLSGAFYVLTSAIAVRSIGAGGVAAGTITGQLIGSMALDAIGAIGLDEEPITATRALGAAGLVLGTYLVVSRREQASPLGGWRRTTFPMAAMIAAGALVSAQHPVNARLADTIEVVPAGLMNFVVGTIVLVIAVVATGAVSHLRAAANVRPWYLTGGLFGAITATSALAVVDEIGAGAVAAATITGQLAASVALDRFGAMGLEPKPLSAARVAGVAMLGIGTYLVVG
jgi:transporter family-2 protein